MLWSSGFRQDDFVKPFWLQTREEERAIMDYFRFEDTLRITMLCPWASLKAVLNPLTQSELLPASFPFSLASAALLGECLYTLLHWAGLCSVSEPALESVNSFQQSLRLLSTTLQSPVAQRKSLTNVLVLSVSLEEEAVPSPSNTINVTNTVIIIQFFPFLFLFSDSSLIGFVE